MYNSVAKTWIRAGYWYVGSESPIPDINSALFTHLICSFATVNSSTYHLSIPSSDDQYFSSFTTIVKRKNPSITTLLSIWNGQAETSKAILGEKANFSILSSMLSKASNRKAFIESSIRSARRYGFQGLDLFWLWPNSTSDTTNMEILLNEWRDAVNSESRNSSQSKLMLTMSLHYVPDFGSFSYPIESIARNLDWGHVVAYDYHLPSKQNVTGAHSALYDPYNNTNTDYGIRQWLSRGFPSEKLVLGLPYHGYAWTLLNPEESEIGAKASGVAVTEDGSMSYKYIKWYTRSYGAQIVYNATYVVNYCVIGSMWIGFDDVEAVKAKIAYAKEKKLLGYNVFLVTNDDNWALSRAAHGEENEQGNKRRLLLIIMIPVAIIIILLSMIICYVSWKPLKAKVLGNLSSARNAENLDNDAPNPQVFSFNKIKKATNNFSLENKLGEGGFGIVYKGKLPRGQEIAVKRLSKTSNQGVEEFKNEVTLTARLQHVNLARVLGYCTEKEEKMLIYEYIPKHSLDFYIFDPIQRHQLDWKRRVHIIEGIVQGLLYLQEYSNFTIIHRDIKASNILLDHDFNPKISDFGMAKLFRKDELEANTDRIVGTYGYVPPEYVRKGTYSMKYDVYSFGVLLSQIISGKRNTQYYGPSESLHLLQYAYQTWEREKGVEFFDPSLDDSSSHCKLNICLQVALLCVQENPEDRPSMLDIFSMLRDETKAIATPKKPAFTEKNVGNVESASTSQKASCSANYFSISDVVPR
ncbi:cysteine-rich receptor-like protein kinase 19 isoform X1 [Morus notabilis]|uniref:cysteine-rich receptor-like protein kinase 19 isoform X1 n=2 Tax=Morus notabilis TaxID=981085 RepID=UPI000CECE4AB|nr:cysteine-rich receptor-like protein kinase 19 isoform X1 [Morus notabilis]